MPGHGDESLVARARGPLGTDTARQVHEVLLPVEWVRGRSAARRRLAGDRLLACELGFEHALAARQARQLPLQVAGARG